jgi:hypothetical protein
MNPPDQAAHFPHCPNVMHIYDSWSHLLQCRAALDDMGSSLLQTPGHLAQLTPHDSKYVQMVTTAQNESDPCMGICVLTLVSDVMCVCVCVCVWSLSTAPLSPGTKAHGTATYPSSQLLLIYI